MEQLLGLLGIAVFTFLAWAFSWDRKVINGRLLFWCFALQFGFAFFVFRSSTGQGVFTYVNSFMISLVEAAMEGPRFVFGSLTDPGTSLGFILFFQGLLTIFVFSALLSILYHIGVMPRLLKLFSSIFSRLTRLSGAESLAATSNIFVGNEAMLTIRPCMPKLTRSEFCLLLAVCMATISVNVLGAYINILQSAFPTIAGHLVSASILSIPAAVLLAKLIAPEKEVPETLGIDVEPHFEKDGNIIETILNASEAGFKMIVGIVSMLIAVVGLLAIGNFLLDLGGEGIAKLTPWHPRCSIEGSFGLVFRPFVWLMGVPASEVPIVANLLGLRMIATEIPAYQQLAELVNANAISPRSAVIAAYALCGFTHIPSMAIFVGGATALAPERRSDIAKVGWRALTAAVLSSFITGAVAGLFFSGQAVLM